VFIKLKEKKEIAEGTMSFTFERPDDFTFIPGQYCTFTLSGEKRLFSIASSDYEKDIIIATRISESNFKQNLKNMKIDDTIEMEGPHGEFIVTNDVKHIVFIAGGIGITPFRSMILHERYMDFPKKIYLFYSNPSQSKTAFLHELQKIHNDNFIFVSTMTQDDSWSGERSRINKELLEKYLTLNECIFYVAGPPVMVHSLKKTLSDSGVTDIISEDFSGY
jgi:ferredoxin-NADP reductase